MENKLQQQTVESLDVGDLLLDHNNTPMFIKQKTFVQRFEFVSGKEKRSTKFCEIEKENGHLSIKHGPIGGKGETQVKKFYSEINLQSKYKNFVKEKLDEGYKEIFETSLFELDNPVGDLQTIIMHIDEIAEHLSKKGWTIQKRKK